MTAMSKQIQEGPSREEMLTILETDRVFIRNMRDLRNRTAGPCPKVDPDMAANIRRALIGDALRRNNVPLRAARQMIRCT